MRLRVYEKSMRQTRSGLLMTMKQGRRKSEQCSEHCAAGIGVLSPAKCCTINDASSPTFLHSSQASITSTSFQRTCCTHTGPKVTLELSPRFLFQLRGGWPRRRARNPMRPQRSQFCSNYILIVPVLSGIQAREPLTDSMQPTGTHYAVPAGD